MYTYNVTLDCIARCTLTVEAESLEDAIQKAYDKPMDDSVPHEWHDAQYVQSCGGDNHWVNGYVQECWKNKDTGFVMYTAVICEYKWDTRELHLKPGVTFSETPERHELLDRLLLTNDQGLYPICSKCGKHFLPTNTAREYPRKRHDEVCKHCKQKK